GDLRLGVLRDLRVPRAARRGRARRARARRRAGGDRAAARRHGALLGLRAHRVAALLRRRVLAMRRASLLLPPGLVLAGGGACRKGTEPPRFGAPLSLGGRTVSVESLEHGRVVYTGYCRPCHGDQGDGKGSAAPGLQPPPRDLRLGVYKFGAVAAGQLPTDADLVRIIRGGLHGTAMQAWDVPLPELDDLIQYVKSSPPRGQKETAGAPVVATPDPWAADAAAGVERGKRVYHGLAQCAVACHPAYVSKEDIYKFTKELTSMTVTDFRI